jgi:cyclic pyranopterin phosphate synthase
MLVDRLARPLSDLRISVTDRCNFRCRYCMPREHFGKSHVFLPRAEILSFEEIARVARLLAGFGLRKVRLTGGEPLLRAELPELVRQLARVPGLEIALTSNGVLLHSQAKALREAGLHRVTVSLDSLDPVVFRTMTDSAFEVTDVLGGIAAARAAGFPFVKINCVVRRGINDLDVVALARHFKGSGNIVRFIEYMDVGATNGWEREQVLSAREILAQLREHWQLVPLEPSAPGEVAQRYGFADGSGEVGVIASVTQPFCGSCNRARLSADGQLFTCLFARVGFDLRALLRSGADDEALGDAIKSLWRARTDRYSELRSEQTRLLPRAEMSYLGG